MPRAQPQSNKRNGDELAHLTRPDLLNSSPRHSRARSVLGTHGRALEAARLAAHYVLERLPKLAIRIVRLLRAARAVGCGRVRQTTALQRVGIATRATR